MIAKGGLPKNRTTLISGTAGSGKTVFARAVSRRRDPEPASPASSSRSRNRRPTSARTCELRLGHRAVGARGQARVRRCLARSRRSSRSRAGSYDLGALLARVEHAVSKVRRERVAVDSLGAVFSQFSDQSIVRRELFRIASALKGMGVTAVLTAERTEDYGPIARFGVEEFIADNVMILRNVLEDESRRRTIEILKFRGTRSPEGRVSVHDRAGRRRHRHSALGDAARAEVVERAHHVGQRGARRDVRRRLLPRFGDAGLGRDGHGQDADGDAVPAGRREQRRALPAARLRGEPRAALPQRDAAGASTSSRWRREGMLRVVCDYPEVAGLEDWLVTIQAIDRGVQAAARRARQPLGARARRDA